MAGPSYRSRIRCRNARVRFSRGLRTLIPASWLLHEQVRAASGGGPQELDRGIAFGERALERVPRGETPRERGSAVVRLQLLEGARHLEQEM